MTRRLLEANGTHETSSNVEMWGLDHDNSVMTRSLLAAGCVILAGLVSGLTLSIFSMTKEELESMMAQTSKTVRSRASRLLWLHQREHWVLVTLLICNAASVEALPLLLEPCLEMSKIVQVLVPTLLVLFFSEILPQSIFVRYAFTISAVLVPFVVVIMIVTAPISFTVGALLDWLVGHRSLRSFRRMELKQLVYENLARSGLVASDGLVSRRRSTMAPAVRQSAVSYASSGHHIVGGGDLTVDEARLMLGALSIAETKVAVKMKPFQHCLWVGEDTQLTPSLISTIVKAGYSRLLVLRGAADRVVEDDGKESGSQLTTNVRFMLTKDLIRLIHSPAEGPFLTPKDFEQYKTVRCMATDTVLEVYLKFMNGQCQLAVVLGADMHPEGIITYSDVMGILTQTQFLDEADLMRELPSQLRVKGHKSRFSARVAVTSERCADEMATPPRSTSRAPSTAAVVSERSALLGTPTAKGK